MFLRLLIVVYFHTGMGNKSICTMFADPLMKPFNRSEYFTLNDNVMGEGVYTMLSSPSEPGRLSLSVQVDIGEPYLIEGMGCGWSPNAVKLLFPEHGVAFKLYKSGRAIRFDSGSGERRPLNLPYSTNVGGSTVEISKTDRELVISAKLPWELLIKFSSTVWLGENWGRLVISLPRSIGGVDRGWDGLCYVTYADGPPTTCGSRAARSMFEQFSRYIRYPKKADVQRWNINRRNVDCIGGTRQRRSFDQMPIVYTYPLGTNVTETVEVHTRKRRYVHAITVNPTLINQVCNKVNDPNGSFGVCVNNRDFNAENQILLCKTMLYGMGTDQPTICVVLQQIAANCRDITSGLTDSIWKPFFGC